MIKNNLALILILVAVIILAYYDSFNNSFIWDDHSFVVENQAIRRLDPKSIVSFFRDKNTASSNAELSQDVWRPLVTLSFAIDYRLWKLNARFYHIENVLLHILNAVLIYLMTLLIIREPKTAFFVSLIFAIHPVQTSTATWISGRSSLLSSLFFLSAIIFHIRNRQVQEREFNYNASLALFLLSLLSKEAAIVLPLILISYDLHFGKKRDMRYYLKYYLPFFLVSVSYLTARFSVVGKLTQREAFWGDNLTDHILTMLKATAGYVRILFLPLNLRAEYVVDISRSILEPYTLAAAVVLLSIAAVYIALRRKRNISFYILWFFIMLLPVLNIMPFKAIMAERFLYLPLVAFASLTGIFISYVRGHLKSGSMAETAGAIVLVSLFLAYGTGTISRNIEWRDELIFCTKEVLRSPTNPRFHYNLGLAYLKEAEKNADSKVLYNAYLAFAIKEFGEAVRLKPDFVWAYVNLGNLHTKVGLYDSAIKDYKKAIAINADHVAYNNLGIAYYHKGMYDETIANCKRALYIKPDHMNSYGNMGNAFFMKKDYAKAKLAWIRSVRLGEDDAKVVENIKDLERQGY